MNETMNQPVAPSPLDAAIFDLARPVGLIKRELTISHPSYGVLLEVKRHFGKTLGRYLTTGQALSLALALLATMRPEFAGDSRPTDSTQPEDSEGLR